MNRPTVDTESARRVAAGQRAKRGLIASYIHELSERHAGNRRAAEAGRAQPATRP